VTDHTIQRVVAVHRGHPPGEDILIIPLKSASIGWIKPTDYAGVKLSFDVVFHRY